MDTIEPGHAVFRKLLPLRLQFRLVQTQIIHATNSQDGNAGKCRADAVHEGPARRAEVVGHGGVWSNGRDVIGPALEVVPPAHVRQVFIIDCEV